MSKDVLYLSHILECIEKIQNYTAEGEEVFKKEEKTQDAVLRNLQILAESSTRLSPEIINQYPHLPWREMRSFRNLIVHEYLGVEIEQVWTIVSDDLPALKVEIEKILKSE